MNKNDFTKEENREAAKYKLWIGIKESEVRSVGRRVKVFYGYRTKRDKGLSFLLKQAEQWKDVAWSIRLYDNQTKEIIKKIK